MHHQGSLISQTAVAPAPRAEPAAVDRVRGGTVALVLVGAAWVVVLALYLRHRIVLSSDSVNNYVHVWWIARDLWHHGRIPLRMPVLGHGDAFAYPYGFFNWTTAAIVWPLFGDWTVTLWTALGAVACLAATFFAFPELRRGYWAAAVLANSAILESMLFGQQSFAWAAALLLAGVGAWRRGHKVTAVVLVGLGQATHAAIVLPIGVIMVALCLPFVRDRAEVLRWYALTLVITLPAVVLVFASPGYADTPASSRALNFFITLGPRVLVVALPLLFVAMRSTGVRAYAPLALVLSLTANAAFELPLNVAYQWRALDRTFNTATLDTYLHSDEFVPGATYRVLRGAGDGKLGLYRVVEAGGRLDSELFPESMAMHNFKTLADYEHLLCVRHVDFVIHYASYDASRGTNEHEMIARLAAPGDHRVQLRRVQSAPGHDVYAVNRENC